MDGMIMTSENMKYEYKKPLNKWIDLDLHEVVYRTHSFNLANYMITFYWGFESNPDAAVISIWNTEKTAFESIISSEELEGIDAGQLIHYRFKYKY